MRTIVHSKGLLHIETPLGIVNIKVGLLDTKLRKVESVSVTPNSTCGDTRVVRRGIANTRLVELKGKRKFQ